MWWSKVAEAQEMIVDADIAWVDMRQDQMDAAFRAGTKLQWVTTIYAGLDAFPLDILRERGAILTNGVGINAVAVAEYAVLGVLAGRSDSIR